MGSSSAEGVSELPERAAATDGAEAPPFLSWPGWAHLGYTAFLGLLCGLWFAAIYGGANAWTAIRTLRVPLYFEAELGIPFVPWMAGVYMSIYLLFLAAPFILRGRREHRALVITIAAVTLAAGITYLALPSQDYYAPPATQGSWHELFRFADWLNLEYNNVPSLHVALSVICLLAFARKARVFGRTLLLIWAVALSLSCLVIHQHHVADVLTGWLYAAAGDRCVYARLVAAPA